MKKHYIYGFIVMIVGSMLLKVADLIIKIFTLSSKTTQAILDISSVTIAIASLVFIVYFSVVRAKHSKNFEEKMNTYLEEVGGDSACIKCKLLCRMVKANKNKSSAWCIVGLSEKELIIAMLGLMNELLYGYRIPLNDLKHFGIKRNKITGSYKVRIILNDTFVFVIPQKLVGSGIISQPEETKEFIRRMEQELLYQNR